MEKNMATQIDVSAGKGSLREISSLTEEQVNLLKRTICKEATNDELSLFLHACNRTKLDPFMKQIYAVQRGNVMTIQTGIDGYRLIAERTGNYMPGKEPSFAYDSNNYLVSATSYVKKMDSKGDWHEIACTAFLKEYEGNGMGWKKMPHIMLAKVAEAAALRKAFPADLSGFYTSEEMEQADIHSIEKIDYFAPEETFISEHQSQVLKAVIEIGILPYEPGYMEKFLKSCKLVSIDKIPADRYERAMLFLNKKVESLKSKEVEL